MKSALTSSGAIPPSADGESGQQVERDRRDRRGGRRSGPGRQHERDRADLDERHRRTGTGSGDNSRQEQFAQLRQPLRRADRHDHVIGQALVRSGRGDGLVPATSDDRGARASPEGRPRG